MRRFFSSFLAGLCLMTFVSNCDVNHRHATSSTSQEPPKVVLITVDGVRWQEIFGGTDPLLRRGEKISPEDLLPNLHKYFVEGGEVFGERSSVFASGTNHISLPGYLEMMRGFPTEDCVTNFCEPRLETTLLDHFTRAAVFSSWDTVRKSTTSDPDRFVINSGRNYRSAAYESLRLRDDRDFDCYVGHLDYRPDEFTMVSVRDYISHEKPQFLWASFGDTDEYAHMGNYDGYITALKNVDRYVGEMIESYGDDTIFVVTTDHGRSQDWRHHGYDLESSRIWLMIRGRGVPHIGHVDLGRKSSLSDVLPTVLSVTSGNPEKNSFI